MYNPLLGSRSFPSVSFHFLQLKISNMPKKHTLPLSQAFGRCYFSLYEKYGVKSL